MTDGRASTAASRVSVLCGVDVHSDPWHALEATSQQIVDVLKGDGYQSATIVTTDHPAQLAAALDTADVLIVNASSDLSREPHDSTPVVDLISKYSRRGGGILASHSSTLAFRDDPRWAALLGGRWVPGETMHPQIGNSLIQATMHRVDGLQFDDFTVYDERYTHLKVAEESNILAFHTEDGIVHPLIWSLEASGDHGRVAYNALGHGVESYDSTAHQEVFKSLVRWVGDADAAGGRL